MTKQIGKYIVHPNGDIFSLYSNRLLKPSNDKDGYKKVILYFEDNKKDYRVHRLVAELFIDNPQNLPEVNHKNGIKSDNSVNNLEWCTTKQNIIHCIKTGLKYKNYTQSELNRITGGGVIKHYASLNDKEKESRGATGYKNPAYGKNYLQGKNNEDINEIKRKKIETHNLNKSTHLNTKGNEIIISGLEYKSILYASKILGVSFKYIKRRLSSNDYVEYQYKGDPRQ